MKARLTVTIDAEVLERAWKLATAQKTSISALVEDLLHSIPIPDFATRWLGKFVLAPTREYDKRMNALKKKYKLQ